MYVLTNDTTGERLKLTNKVAEKVFNLTDEHQHLICLPSKQPVKSQQNAHLTVNVRRIGQKAKEIGGTCVVRMGGIGDLANLSSTLVKIKKKHPKKPVTLATLKRHIDFMTGVKGVDHVISIDDLGKYKFDDVIDLRYSVEPANIGPGSLTWREYTCNDRSDNFDALCGVNSKRKHFNLNVDKHLQEKWRKLLKGRQKPWIAFIPTCTSMLRAVPPEFVRPVIKKLKDSTIVLFGRTEGWNLDLLYIDYENVVNVLDRMDIPDLVAMCSLMDLVITPDTGALHVGAALNRKVLGLFGNIDPSTRTTYYKTVKTLYPKGKLNCIPCWDVPGACECDQPGADCMRFHTPDVIVRNARQMLK